MKARYEMYDRGEFIGEFTASEIAKRLGYARSTIVSYISRDECISGRYRLRRIIEGKLGDDLLEAWDRERQRLRDSGYDLSRIRIAVKERE